MATLNAERRKARGAGLGTNVLFFVSILVAFIVFMYAVNRDAKKEISPFAGGPAPSMSGTPGNQPDQPVAAGSGISGTISMDPKLAQEVSADGTLFLILRNSGMPAAGPPAAVKRYGSPQLPLQFDIGPGDVMMQGAPFTGPFDLTVRLDRDGNAMTKDPSDLTSAAPATGLAVGRTDVAVVLSRRLSDSAPEGAASPSGAPAAKPEGARFKASVSVADPLKGSIPKNAILYVVVRNAGLPAAGPPLAVKRLADVQFPVEFDVGPEDVMMQGMPFVGPFTISARLDQDGNAMTKAPGDLVASGAAPTVEDGAEVTIELDRRL